MPATKVVNQAAATNAMNGLQFEDIPLGGAYVSLWASGVTAGDTISLKVGQKDYLDLAEPNIEISADVVDTDRDQILFREPMRSGKIFLGIIVTTAINFLLVQEYRGA